MTLILIKVLIVTVANFTDQNISCLYVPNLDFLIPSTAHKPTSTGNQYMQCWNIQLYVYTLEVFFQFVDHIYIYIILKSIILNENILAISIYRIDSAEFEKLIFISYGLNKKEDKRGRHVDDQILRLYSLSHLRLLSLMLVSEIAPSWPPV